MRSFPEILQVLVLTRGGGDPKKLGDGRVVDYDGEIERSFEQTEFKKVGWKKGGGGE